MRHAHIERTLACTAAVACFALGAGADELELRGGGRLRGIIVERTPTAITIETGPGRVTLPLTRVVRVLDGRSALEAWRERSSRLSQGDAAGWAQLARWAGDNELLTQARMAWERVLVLDPDNPEANAALGNVRRDGHWTTPEQPLPEPPAAPAERSSAAEQAARVREAEARAREAEARARAAEAAATATVQTDGGDSGGIPIGWAYGLPAVPALVPRPDSHEDPPPCCDPSPTPQPEPPQPRTPSSLSPSDPPMVPRPAPVRERPGPADRAERPDQPRRSSIR